MKTASLTPPSLHFIDTAPFAARYLALVSLVMSFIAAGRSIEVLRLSYKVARLARVFIRLDTHNRLLARKLSMLANPNWRERVLRELGGLRKLKLWEAAQQRVKERAKHPPRPDLYDRAWLYTPERKAESERLKAQARLCAKACAPANIVRDRCKMDFDGMFRLAPLSRYSQKERKVRIYTRDSLSDYSYNAIPFAQTQGLGPATIWPIEFYAAMAMKLDETHTLSVTLPAKQNARDGVLPVKSSPQSLDPPSSPLRGSCGMTEDEIFLIPLHAAIDLKTYRSLFENPV